MVNPSAVRRLPGELPPGTQVWLDVAVGVLSSLLPGVRDLRAPLAAGYILLLDLWLIIGDRIPDPDKATGVAERLHRLGGFVTPFGLAIALGFMAYLAGLIFVALYRRLLALEWSVETSLRRLLRFSEPRRQADEIYPLFLRSRVRVRVNEHPLPDARTVLALQKTVASYGFDELKQDPSAFDPEDGWLRNPGALLPDELTTIDRQGVITQLMTNRDMQTLYGEFDRQRSESQFRVAIFLPLVFLLSILALEVHWLYGVMLVGPVYLLGEARILKQRAEDSLTAAVTSQGAQSLFLVSLRESLQAEESALAREAREEDEAARLRGGDV